MVEIVGHSQTKGRDNREPKLRPKPARQSSTLPMSEVWKRSHGRTNKAPPDERGGNRYVRPKATAPHLDSTNGGYRRSRGGAAGVAPASGNVLALRHLPFVPKDEASALKNWRPSRPA